MENMEMVKLLVYKNDKPYLDGVDLAKLTNMYYLTIYDFLFLMRIYFRNNTKNGFGAYTINTNEVDKYTPNDPIRKIRYIVEGEILVEKASYEEYKKQIFDFAYTRCNALADRCFREYEIKEGTELDVQRKMSELKDTYTCFYKSSERSWNYMISDIQIDREEESKMYEVLNSLSEIEKQKVLRK